MQVEVISLDIQNMCRTCLALKGTLLPIYDTKLCLEDSVDVADMLKDLTSIPLNRSDGMPENVCPDCLSEINRCYTFKMKCDNADRKLRLLLSIADELVGPKEEQQIKIEPNTLDSLFDYDQQQGTNEDVEHSVLSNEKVGPFHFFAISDEKTDCGEENQEKNTDDYDKTLHNQARKNRATEVDVVTDDTEGFKITTRRSSLRKKSKLKCFVCPRSFFYPENRIRHMKECHNKGERLCNSKPTQQNKTHEVKLRSIKDFEGNNDLEEAQMVKKKIDVKKFKHCCPRCAAGFVEEISLRIHFQRNECTRKQYPCSKCQKVFISLSKFNGHVLAHVKELTYAYCSEPSRTGESKVRKVGQHGRKAKNVCQICKKAFSVLSSLKDHLRVHSGEKPFLCSVCGRGFSQNSNLKQHIMRHNNNKPFKCVQCPRSFVSKGELCSHIRSHTGDHPFTCDICKMAFTTSSSLVKHKRIHTGERPYACEFCPMRFNALNTLKDHERTHTGEKPFKCKFCQRGFAKQSECMIHMRTHTGERRHICHVCGVTFQQSGSLRTHMKKHSGQKEEKRSPSVIDWVDEDEIKEEHL